MHITKVFYMTVSFIQVGKKSEENCAICLDPLTADVWAHDVHSFHGRCITQAVHNDPSCPLCRRQVDNTTLLARDVLLKKEVKMLNKGFKACLVIMVSLYSIAWMGKDSPINGMLQCVGLTFFIAALILRHCGESTQLRRA